MRLQKHSPCRLVAFCPSPPIHYHLDGRGPWDHPLPDVGNGLFQYFLKLVPTVHPVDPPLDGARWGPARLEEAIDAVVTSQFAYTFKFRSMKGYTQYHREHQARVPDHHAPHGVDKEAKDSKDSGSTKYNILPGECSYLTSKAGIRPVARGPSPVRLRPFSSIFI